MILSKKQRILVMTLLIVLVVFVGCGGTSCVESPPVDTTPSETTKLGDFIVSGEKYAYRNKNVLLLNVENQTEKNYNVTAVVYYFDAEGNEIKSQEQTFIGWSSGYQNYFYFQPNIIFDTFTYTLELEECTGEECHAQFVTTTFAGVSEDLVTIAELVQKGDFTKVPVIAAKFSVKNSASNILYISGFRILIDKNNNIYCADKVTQHRLSPQVEDYKPIVAYYNLNSENLIWPEELVGDVKGVYVITRVWQ